MPEDVLAVLSGGSPRATKDLRVGDPGEFPFLITHHLCSFTTPAASLWREAASANGQSLRVVFADTPEGESLIHALNVRGVPCLANAEGELHYGLTSPESAVAVLEN